MYYLKKRGIINIVYRTKHTEAKFCMLCKGCRKAMWFADYVL